MKDQCRLCNAPAKPVKPLRGWQLVTKVPLCREHWQEAVARAEVTR